MTVIRRRLLGLVFFVVVALFFALTIMKFNKDFTTFTDVTLKTDSVGNALPTESVLSVTSVKVVKSLLNFMIVSAKNSATTTKNTSPSNRRRITVIA